MSATALPQSFSVIDHHAHQATDNCPWCEQPVPHDQFQLIKSRIEAQERQRSDEVTKKLTAQFTAEKANDAAKAKAEIEQAKQNFSSQIEALQKQSLAREASIRDETKKAAEASMQSQVQAAQQQLRTLQASQEQVLNRRLLEQREALEKSSIAAVNTERAKSFEKEQKLQGIVQDLQRKLENKTAQELGEGAEVDLYEALKADFPDDKITRVDKGAPGDDLIHEVIHNGKSCGTIVYDSKNRNAWRNDFVTKLREDQLSAKADHAILSTLAFPAGMHQLHLQEGVIVTNPARVIALVQLVRKHVLQMHTMRVSNETRDQKTAALYAFITSERCSMFLNGIEQKTQDMLDLEVKEQTAHKNTWTRRGQLLRDVQKIKVDLCSEIDHIIGTAAAAD
jgi:hypothetical protein